jgi:hypothetical protein
MDRRTVIGAGLVLLLDACGGGGSGGAPVAGTPAPAPSSSAPSPSPAPSPAAAPPPPAPTPITAASLSPNIACWGDSLTEFFALNLQLLVAGRVVFDGGYLGQTSTVIADHMTADTTMTTWISVFWYGHNNDHDPATIKADIARSIAHLAPGNNRFIVLSMLNKAQPDELKGTPEYATLMQLNADLAAQYPDNYLDVRSWLIAHYDPNNWQDVIDVGNDTIPSSLRYDEIHLRNEGSVLVAQRVKQFIDAKGW